ncbi:MAG: response regulator [Desulfobacterales bacterium]|nr:response regulator [Desulfobacterales bacterium]
MKKKSILIVDDEVDIRIFLSTLTKVNGYDPVLAKNGKEGMLKAQEVKPDLVIMDIMMPGEGGIQMYQHIRTDPNLKDTPIIMLSAIAKKTFYHYLRMMNFTMEDAIMSPNAYIEKPPDAEELTQMIQSILKN